MSTSRVLLGVLAVAMVSACSSQIEKKTASGSYAYLEHSQQPQMVVPNDVDTPEYSADYNIPNADSRSTLIGRDLLVYSPQLVLPIAAGTYVEDGKKSASVWFDQVDDSKQLDQVVWNSLLAFLDEIEVGVENFDPENQTLTTKSMVTVVEGDSAWYLLQNSDKNVAQQFVFNLAMAPHGRSAELTASLLNSSKDDASASGLDERRATVDIINRVVNYYQYQIELKDSQRLAEIRKGLGTEMGFDADGEAAMVINAEYDIAWPRLMLVLQKLGFDIKDIDKSSGLMFVFYGDRDVSWWQSMLSSSGDLLEQGDYRIKVSTLGSKTAVTFMDSESSPFTPKDVSNLYSSFADMMQQDDLDI